MFRFHLSFNMFVQHILHGFVDIGQKTVNSRLKRKKGGFLKL